MLKLYHNLHSIDFSKLMELYAQGNAENARDCYPHEELLVGIRKAELDFYQYLREVFFCVEGSVYAVWEEDGIYLSALRLEPYRDGLLLEALETHLQHRRQGYGRELITSVLDQLRLQGVQKVYSHVNKRNSPSINCHLACGFERIAEQATYIDGSVTNRSCTMVRIL